MMQSDDDKSKMIKQQILAQLIDSANKLVADRLPGAKPKAMAIDIKAMQPMDQMSAEMPEDEMGPDESDEQPVQMDTPADQEKLEHMEEETHMDLDHDDEQGESPEHTAKVMGVSPENENEDLNRLIALHMAKKGK